MKIIGKFEFPEHYNEVEDWRTIYIRRMLHSQVMCLAKTRIEGEWAAYCFPVPGMNHEEEECFWEEKGDKLPEAYARVIFPEFEGVPYAR